MKRRRSSFWLTLAGVLLLAACGGPRGAQRGTLSPAELRRQLVAYQQTRFHQRQFFIGLAAGADLQQATQAAFAEIAAQLTWLPPGSPGLLRGLYRVDRSATDNGGQVQLLAVLERDASAAYLKRRARELEQAALQRLVRCRQTLQSGELAPAKQCLGQVERELERVKELLVAAQAALGDRPTPHSLAGEQQAAELRRQLEAGLLSKKVVLLRVLQRVDDQPQPHLDQAFGALLQRRGYQQLTCTLPDNAVRQGLAGQLEALLEAAAAAGSGLALVGQVEARFTSEISGQFFSYADGLLRLIDMTSGRVVLEAAVRQVKGGHITRERACQKAVDNAILQLQRQLAAALKPA